MSGGLFSNLYKKAVPVNARTLLETLLGASHKITEKDLSEEELKALRQAYETAKQKAESHKAQIMDDLLMTKEDYAKKPEMDWGKLVPGQRTTPTPIPYEEFIRRRMAALQSFERTKDKQRVAYNDYRDGMAAPTFDGWLKSIYSSYTDPSYRMKTLLGTFNVHEGPEGQLKAKDSYDFDNAEYYNTFYRTDPHKDSVARMAKRANGPVDLLDMVMIKLGRPSREVEIDLGYKDPFKPTIK